MIGMQPGTRPSSLSIGIRGGLGKFGDGSDGDVTNTTTLTLARDMFYNSLDNTGKTINMAGFHIFCRGTINNTNGTIHRNGNAGAAGSAAGGIATAGAALAAAALGGSGAGGSSTTATAGNNMPGAGGGGGGVACICARIIINTGGTISVNGGIGGAGYTGNIAATTEDVVGGSVASSLGGNGGGSVSTGGTATAPIAAEGGFRSLPFAVILKEIENTVVKITGGAGGGCGLGSGASGTHGASGGGGGCLVLVYNSLTAGTETATGGAGAVKTGDAGNLNGAAGSAGTVIKIQCVV